MNLFKTIMNSLHCKNKRELHNLYTTQYFSKQNEFANESKIVDKIFSYQSLEFFFAPIRYREPEKIWLEVAIPYKLLNLPYISNSVLPIEDYLLRVVAPSVNALSEISANKNKNPSEKCSFEAQITDEVVIARNGCYYSPEKNKFCIRVILNIPLINNTAINGKRTVRAMKELLDEIHKSIININHNELREFINVYEKQQHIRKYLRENDYVSFVANGSILPRLNGTSAPMKNALPFISPPELEIEILCPDNSYIRGMGIKKGITVITGGGYSGKTTLLDSIEMGIYNHILGDGREFVISDEQALKIYAEDGRPVKNLDMSPFFKYFPDGSDIKCFSTYNASGSVSQAANIIEAIYSGVKLLLIDEDKSATNFMIRDKNMRLIVNKEPIIPFTDRIRYLFLKKDVSTILVIGGSSEYLSYADTTILMEDYVARDITKIVDRLNLSKSTCDDYAISWSEKFRYISQSDKKEFIYFHTISAENEKKIIIDEYNADITLLTSLISGEQLNFLASIMENLINSYSQYNTELMNAIINLLGDNKVRNSTRTTDNFKSGLWFEDIRKIDVCCTVFRMRGVNIL